VRKGGNIATPPPEKNGRCPFGKGNYGKVRMGASRTPGRKGGGKTSGKGPLQQRGVAKKEKAEDALPAKKQTIG